MASKAKSPAQKVQEVQRLWEEHKPAFEEHWRAIKDASKFLFKSKHYGEAERQKLKLQNRIAPITLDLYDIVRYIASDIVNQEIYLDVSLEVPEDLTAPEPQYDPALGDFVAPQAPEPKRDIRWAKWALERDIFDPMVGYGRVRDRVAFKAVGTRAGCCVLEWDPAQGPRGRIYARNQDPTRLLWHSDYMHPHEPGNPFVMIEDEVDHDWLVNCSGWDNVDKVVPDGGQMRSDDPSRLPGAGLKARKVTILRCWYLYDQTEKQKLEHTHEPEPLPPGEAYMACADCGWQSGRMNADSMPKAQDCPMCGNVAKPIKTTGLMVPTAGYAKGKRYVVVAPKSPNAGPLVDSGWVGDPPTFPLMYVVLNTDPDDIAGLSDTELNSDLQCMKEGVIRMSYEQLQRNRDWLFVRLGAFTDAAGRPLRFDGSSDFVGYTESRDDLHDIQHFQGTGMNSAVPAMMGILDTSFGRTRGIGQLGIPPEGLKGVQVGVSTRFMESGDVPVTKKADVFRFEESILFTCWHALQRNLWSRPDWIAYAGPNGERGFQALKGEDIPTARIKVTTRPNVDSAEMEHAQKLLELMTNPAVMQSPALLKIVAQSANVPSEWIRDLQKERTEAEAKQAAAAGAAVPGGEPGAGAGMPPLQPNGVPAQALAGA